MTDSIPIRPVGVVNGTVQPPGSKSITNRALVCAALAAGRSELSGVLDSDDTRVMVDSLRRLGIGVSGELPSGRLSVDGCGGQIPVRQAELFVGNSGTTVRFLTALVCLGDGDYLLDGVARMRERPIQDLLDALQPLGADARSVNHTGCPPVRVQAHGLAGGATTIRGNISSQYLSGLMMAAPGARRDVEIVVAGELVSQPYVDMTRHVMASFGVKVIQQAERIVIPAPTTYTGVAYEIEPDASAASYFWAVAAITGGRVLVRGLSRDALQGDVGFCNCLQQMGCDVRYTSEGIEVTGRPLRGIDVNMNAISDTVQTLAAVALFADGTTRIRGVAHNRHKETDRIGDLARELRKLGAEVEEFADGLQITPRALHGASIATYDDHRMAMSLTLAGLRIPGVVIENPGCTAKTYPHYFTDLERLCGTP